MKLRGNDLYPRNFCLKKHLPSETMRKESEKISPE